MARRKRRYSAEAAAAPAPAVDYAIVEVKNMLASLRVPRAPAEVHMVYVSFFLSIYIYMFWGFRNVFEIQMVLF